MKRVTLFSLAALMLAACSQEENGGTMAGQQELQLTSSLEIATRGDVQSTQIVKNETVLAWVSDAGKSGAEAELYNAEKFTAGEGGALLGKAMYFPETGNAVNIRALHGTFSNPVIAAGATAFPVSFNFTVESDQRVGSNAYVKSDLLYASVDGVASVGNLTIAPLTFYHMLSKLELKIINTSDVTDEITSVTLDGVAVSGTFTPTIDADLTQQNERAAMIVASEQTGKMILDRTLIDRGTNDVIVVPQTIGGKTMTFTLADGSALFYNFPENKKFESGKRYVYTVTLKDRRLSVDSSIEPWDASEGENEGSATLPDPTKARVGDFFYADGTVSTELNPDKIVIGIVFQTNANRIGQAEKDALKQRGINKPHGLVMSLKKAAEDVAWCAEEAERNFPELTDCKTKDLCNNDISGLHNYNTVISYAERMEKLSLYPAFKAVKDYVVAAPDNTTGWFLPSVGQVYDFLVNLGGLPSWDKADDMAPDTYQCKWDWSVARIDDYHLAPLGEGKYDKFGPFSSLLTSSEVSGDRACSWSHFSGIGTYNVCYSGSFKMSEDIVRPILAF